jgi:excisionase family DNA binding protein
VDRDSALATSDPPARLLLAYAEVAQRLGVSTRTVRGLVYRGALPSVHIGTRRLVALADLVDFLDALRAEGKT